LNKSLDQGTDRLATPQPMVIDPSAQTSSDEKKNNAFDG
jgi:hypothetical protein